MKKIIHKILNKIAQFFHLRVVDELSYQTKSHYYDEINELLERKEANFSKALSFLMDSKSQIQQDLFVLQELEFKEKGFFVEFGATNGITLSNTYLLEKQFGWTGILAEPAKMWHDDLKKNRTASIETNCVWKTTGETLNFNEVAVGELSTIASFNEADSHKTSRNKGEVYQVKTISLLDLLRQHNAPKHIDFLSIDTEGSEYEILKHFDFNSYSFKVIAVEHNYTILRESIYDLLTSKGYKRKYTGLSRWDDWYVKINE